MSNYATYQGDSVYTALLAYDTETDILVSFSYDGDIATVLSYQTFEVNTDKAKIVDDYNRALIVKGLTFLMDRIAEGGEKFIDDKVWNKQYILS